MFDLSRVKRYQHSLLIRQSAHNFLQYWLMKFVIFVRNFDIHKLINLQSFFRKYFLGPFYG